MLCVLDGVLYNCSLLYVLCYLTVLYRGEIGCSSPTVQADCMTCYCVMLLEKLLLIYITIKTPPGCQFSLLWDYHTPVLCYSTPLLYAVTLHCYSTLLLYTVTVHCYCILLLYTVAIHCCCTMLLYTVAVHCCCTLLLYTAAVHCCCKLLL